jgi:hypothetical protein
MGDSTSNEGTAMTDGNALPNRDPPDVTRFKAAAAKRVQAHRVRARMGLRCRRCNPASGRSACGFILRLNRFKQRNFVDPRFSQGIESWQSVRRDGADVARCPF